MAQRAKEKGFLRGLDGRILPVRSLHSALNTLLQSAGSVTVKQATVLFHRNMAALGYEHCRDYRQLAHIHDEWQSACPPSLAETLGETAIRSMTEAGAYFRLRVPITGEYKIGRNWAETH